MLGVLRLMDVAETGAAFTDEADVDRILDRPGLDLEGNTRVLSEAAGLIGFAALEVLDGRRQLRATVGVRPEAADHATTLLLGWVEHRARELAAQRGWPTATAVIWQLPGGVAEPVFRDRGWLTVRRYHHLTRDLDPTRPPAMSGDSAAAIGVVTDDHLAGQVHDVLEAALAGHWEHQPRPLRRFLADEHAAPGFDRSLWFLAYVDGHPAAAVIARHLGDRAWIAHIGTVSAYRGRGLARAVLAAAIAEVTRRGSTRIDLDVDTGNDTGAVGLYETAGFRTEYQLDQWHHTTPAAPSAVWHLPS